MAGGTGSGAEAGTKGKEMSTLASQSVWLMEQNGWTGPLIRTDYMRLDGAAVAASPHVCASCGDGLGMLQWQPPFYAEYDSRGKQLADIGRHSTGDLIVTERVKQAFEKAKVTGYVLRGEVFLKKGHPKKFLSTDTQRRFLLEVAFSRIRVDEAASNCYRHKSVRCFACDSGMAKFDRIVFEQPLPKPMPDMFVAYNLTARVWVADRVKRLIEENGFTGVHFVAPEDYKLDDPLYREPGDIAMAKIKDPDAFLREHVRKCEEAERLKAEKQAAKTARKKAAKKRARR